MKKGFFRKIVSHFVFFATFALMLFGLIYATSFVQLNIFESSQLETNKIVALGAFASLMPLFFFTLLFVYPRLQRSFSYLDGIKLTALSADDPF